MKIGIDLDGTVFQTYERMAEIYELETGKVFDLSLIFNWDKKSPIYQWIQKYFDKSTCYNDDPYPNAIKVLRELAKRHELYFITSRRPETEEETRRIMKSYGFDKKIFIVSRENKVETYKLLKLDLILEDELCFSLPLISKRTKVILFDRPWNQEDACYCCGFRRIFSWTQIYPALHQLFEI